MIDVKIAGSQLTPGDRQYWAHEATVVEDATSDCLVDTFGGVGSIAVDTDLLDNTVLTQGTPLEVTFTGAGTRTAIIQSITATNGATATVNGDTEQARLRRTISARVVKTTIGDALKQYLGKCGLTPSQYSIDPSIASRPCMLPGWRGDAWEKIKEMGAVERFEIADVAGVVTIRPIGSITMDISTFDSKVETLEENIQGKFVESHFYDYTSITNGIVYPPAEYDEDTGGTIPAGWRPEYDVIEVTPGEPVEFDVPILASLTSVKQPRPVELIGPDYVADSVYTVMTADGVDTVTPSVWTKKGGKVTVTILPDTQTLRIRVTAGQNLMEAAPYRLCLTSGGGRDYSTLRIVGTGIRISKTRLRLRTSVPEMLTDQEVASSTDSMFCRTQSHARKQLRAQASIASRSIGGMQAQIGEVPNVFGERAGAIIRGDHANYRVRSSSTNSMSTALQADRHTTIADFNAAWAGKTIAEFNEVWEGYTLRASNGAPLRTELPVAPVLPVTVGYGFGRYGGGEYGE